MLTLLKKKNVVANIKLDAYDELSALKAIADRAADKLNVNEQELKSGFFASGSQDSIIIGEQAVILHATSTTLTSPETVVMSFAQPINWGEDGSKVNIAVAIVLPANDGDSMYNDLLNKARVTISNHIEELDELSSSNSGLKTLWKEIN